MHPSQRVIDAIDRLFTKAMWDTGQARKVAQFLMSWGNEPVHGGFDFAHIRSLDSEIADDMWTLMEYLFASGFKYPIDIGYEERFVALVRLYRPDLFKPQAFRSGAGEAARYITADSRRQANTQRPNLEDLAPFLDHKSADSLALYRPDGEDA